MEPNELLKKVRKLEIKSRGLSNHIFSGEYHSAFKGRGMAFSEVREYRFGDDIRAIDWNVTARFNHPFVKIYEEERELTAMLLVDVSGSGNFGSVSQFKNDLITEICAVLAFSAIQNNDKIGVIFFSDRIEKFIPPKKGKTHILRIIRELLEYKPESTGTDLNVVLQYFSNMIKRKSIVFLISDFLDTNFEQTIKIAARKHDLIAIRVFDNREVVLPRSGLVRLKDSETDKSIWVDTSKKKVRNAYSEWWNTKEKHLFNLFSRNHISFANLKTGESYIEPLMKMFKNRGKK